MVVKIGREEPVVSMDTGGKVIWARHNEIQTVNVRSVGDVDLTVRFPSLTESFQIMEASKKLCSKDRQKLHFD